MFTKSIVLITWCVLVCQSEDYGCLFYKAVLYKTHICENLNEERGAWTDQQFCTENRTVNFDKNSEFAKNLVNLTGGECDLPLTDEDIDHSNETVFVSNDPNVSAIDTAWFTKGNNITTVILQYGKIEEIDPTSFENIPNLVELKITLNALRRVDLKTFEKVPRLKYLYLNDNQIATVEIGNSQLEKLQLSTNNISHVGVSNFNQLRKLKHLDLSLNKITTIEHCSFCKLVDIGVLDIKLNFLTELSNDFDKGLTKLWNLDIIENRLLFIRNNTFTETNSSLERLLLSDNKIATIDPNSFRFMKKLRTLYLNFNSLLELPGDVFYGLSSLETLTLSENHLKSLPNNIFNGLANMIHLFLGNNQLKMLPGDLLIGLGRLELFNVEKNDLVDLHHNLFKPVPNIATVTISHNRLTFLYAELLNIFKTDKHPSFFGFHDNPWQCSCLDDILRRFNDLGITYDFYKGSKTKNNRILKSLICVQVQNAEDFCIKDLIFTKDFPNIYFWARNRFNFTHNKYESSFYNLKNEGWTDENITDYFKGLADLAGVQSKNVYGVNLK